MIRLTCFVAMALALSGCNQIKAVAQSRQAKITQAFPLAAELRTAPDMLFAALGDAPNAKAIRYQYSLMLEARTERCGGKVVLERFDGPEEVKRKIGNASCFGAFDQGLLEWVGIKRAALELAKPPLVSAATLAPRVVLPPQLGQIQKLTIASGANVALLKGTSEKLTAIELPSARVISSFSVPPFGENAMTLSPNGRVLAIGDSNTLRMLDVVSGKTLWSTRNFNSVLSWLPDVSAAVLARSQSGGGVALLDVQSAALSSYPAPIPRPTWSAQGTDKPGRLLIGDHANVAVIDHTRRSDGSLDVSNAKQYQLPPANFIHPEHFISMRKPFLMSKGRKLVYMNRRDWAWLDLETGEGGKWNAAALGTTRVAQVSDTDIYLEISGDQVPIPAQIFNVEQATLANVRSPAPASGILYPATPRWGYVLHSNGSVVIGNDIAAEGDARPIEEMASQIELAQQVSKIRNPGPEETIKLTPWPDGQEVGTNPRMQGVPANAHVFAIGVNKPVAKGQGLTPGKIDVKLAASRIPIVLILTSYEAVLWNIQPNGRPIAAVILSSYEGSKVTGYEGNVVVIGRATSREPGTPEYKKLRAAVAEYVPMPIRLFQGAYAGWEFSVPAD